MPSKHPIPVATVLAAISSQLDALCEQTASLEDAVSPHIAEGGNLPDQTIWELQGLDWIRQSLEDLSLLTGQLAKENITDSLTPKQVKTVSTPLRLSSTKSLLRPGLDGADIPRMRKPQSDVQLF